MQKGLQHGYNMVTTWLQHAYNMLTTWLQYGYNMFTTVQHRYNCRTWLQLYYMVTTWLQHGYNMVTTVQHGYNCNLEIIIWENVEDTRGTFQLTSCTGPNFKFPGQSVQYKYRLPEVNGTVHHVHQMNDPLLVKMWRYCCFLLKGLITIIFPPYSLWIICAEAKFKEFEPRLTS